MSDVPRIDPVAVRSAQFQGSFRKYDSRAVDQYLADLADDLVKVNNHIDELERQVVAAARATTARAETEVTATTTTPPGDAAPPTIFEPASLSSLSDDALTQLVGEETAHVLSTARQAGDDIRAKAEESASRLVRESTAEAKQLREEAEAEAGRIRTEAEEVRDRAKSEAEAEAQRILDQANADAERRVTEARAMADDELVRAERVRAEADEDAERVRNGAKEEGRAMLAEAKEVRKQILEDLQKRRDQGRAQIERLVVGRDRLLDAYASVRTNVDEMSHELQTVLDSPFERAPGIDEGFVGIVVTSADEEAEEEARSEAEGSDAVAEGSDAVADGHPVDAGPTPVDDGATTATDADPAVEPNDTDTDEPDAVADAEQAHDSESASAEAGSADVDQLFARIRAERDESVARAQAVLGDEAIAADEADNDGETADEAAVVSSEPDEADVSSEPDEAEPSGDVDQIPAEHLATGPVYEHRREVVQALSKELSRGLKRQLADEQNQVLDALRRTESTAVDDLLPAEDDHLASFVDVAAPILTAAADAASATTEAASAPDVGAVAQSLATALVGPFRRRVSNSASEVGDDHEALDERLRSLYREWKIEHLDPAATDALYSAYALGQYSSAPDEARFRWLIDPEQGPCPDAQDNALEGSVAKGSAFPTGDHCPQAHAGCHCLLLVESG